MLDQREHVLENGAIDTADYLRFLVESSTNHFNTTAVLSDSYIARHLTYKLAGLACKVLTQQAAVVAEQY